MSAPLALIIVMTMQHVLILLVHLLVLVTLDTVEAEFHVEVGRRSKVLLILSFLVV